MVARSVPVTHTVEKRQIYVKCVLRALNPIVAPGQNVAADLVGRFVTIDFNENTRHSLN